MTTTVRVLIEGNKKCVAQVKTPDGPDSTPVEVLPGQFKVLTIHGEQTLTVKEEGPFIS